MAAEGGTGARPVLLVEPLGDGGIAHYTFNLARALRAVGVRPLLCTAARYEFADSPWPPGDLWNRLFRVAFLLIRLFPGLDVEHGAAARLRRGVKALEYPFDALETAVRARLAGVRVLHLQTVNTVDVLVVLAARLCGLRVVTTVHNVNPLHGTLTPLHRHGLGLLYRLSGRIIIHTREGKEQLQELFGLEGERIAVIPHGDYSFFVTEFAGEDEPGAGGPCLLFFGAIRPNKGLDVLLRAMPRILAAHPACRLRVVGEPVGDFAPYRRLMDELDLAGSVDLVLGYVENEAVAPHFRAATAAVLPYREITQSGVLQIALACGTPAVAADLPGFREIIEPGVTGLLFPPGDDAALAAACVRVLDDPDAARAMAARARAVSQEAFAWDVIARRTVDEVYADLQPVS